MSARHEDRVASGLERIPAGELGLPVMEELEPRLLLSAVHVVTTGLAITVDPLVTTDTTPELTGHVNSAVATIGVTVDGNQYAGVNNGDGTWTLADDTIDPALDDGIYDVVATATVLLIVRSDTTTNELVVQSSGLAVGVDSLLTTDTTPRLTGTVSDTAATVEVVVDGNTYDAINNGDGTWTLPDNTIDPALLPMDYDVAVTATHGLHVATDNTTDELKVRAKVSLGGSDDVSQAAFTDADGSAVIVGLSPARIGQVDLYFKSGSAVAVVGSARTRVITAEGGVALDIVDVVSDARVLSVRTRRGETGGTTIGTITGDASLGKLSGRSTDLTGDGIDMDGGVIGSLILRNIQADVTMGAQWDRGIVLRVGRNIEGSNMLIGDSGVRSFVTGALINSSVLVDVGSPVDADLDQVYDLPDVDDIDGPKLIWTLKIRGYHGAPDDLVQNANVAAAAIFSASLRQAALDNGGSDFGLAAQTIGRLRLRQDNQTYLFGEHWLADPDDLTVRIDVA